MHGYRTSIRDIRRTRCAERRIYAFSRRAPSARRLRSRAWKLTPTVTDRTVCVITHGNAFMLSTWKIRRRSRPGPRSAKARGMEPPHRVIVVEIANEGASPRGVDTVWIRLGCRARAMSTPHQGDRPRESATAEHNAQGCTLKRVHSSFGSRTPSSGSTTPDTRALDAALSRSTLERERATSSSRALVQASIYDEFIKRAVER